ncbi:MAG: recombinase family protein [Acidobacteria bacterium]|nr:recombinase family protein [Acidobacteriota bacterium]
MQVTHSRELVFAAVLRRLVQTLTKRGIRAEFVKECLSFTGEDSPVANLLLSVMGAFAEIEQALIREGQREGVALAKQRGAYRGRKKALVDSIVATSRVSLSLMRKL